MRRVAGYLFVSFAVLVNIPVGVLMTIGGDLRGLGQLGPAAVLIYFGRRLISEPDRHREAPPSPTPSTQK